MVVFFFVQFNKKKFYLIFFLLVVSKDLMKDSRGRYWWELVFVVLLVLIMYCLILRNLKENNVFTKNNYLFFLYKRLNNLSVVKLQNTNIPHYLLNPSSDINKIVMRPHGKL